MMTKQQIAAIVPTLLAAASLCFGQYAKLAPDLEGRDPEASVNVIVRYNRPVQQSHIDAILRRGGRHLRTLGVGNGAVYSVTAKSLAELANDPDVAYISPDRAVKATSSSQLQSDYKLQAVGANTAQTNGYNGAGIGVAIIDSGITNKTDLHGGSSNSSSTSSSVFGSSGGGGYRV